MTVGRLIANDEMAPASAGTGRRFIARAGLMGGLTLVGLAALVVIAAIAPARDLHAYWTFSATNPYGGLEAQFDAFLYSPPAALVMLPLRLLDFEVLRVLWLGVQVACLVYLVGPWAIAAIALPPVAQELTFGNIQLPMAVAIVAGFRRPAAAWTLILLTKVTPGVGLLWFAIRREWRSLASALGLTGLLVMISLILAPGWWPEWINALSNSASVALPFGFTPSHVMIALPVWVRLAPAAGVIVWGARTDRRWTVAVGAMLAMPSLWMSAAVLLLAIPRLYGADQTSRVIGPRNVPL